MADDPSEESGFALGPRPNPPARQRRPLQRGGSHLLIAVLCALLGFAIIVQVRRTDSGDALSTARPQDLVAIFDGLQRRADDLTADIAALEKTLAALQAGGASSQEALAEAQRRAEALAILAGTAPASGPGVVLTMTDPQRRMTPEVLLAALQELRNAGAEAIQVNDVRIGVDSYFAGRAGEIVADGTAIAAPYTFRAIGDPLTLTAAMRIPGGVSDTVTRAGGALNISETETLVIDALRPLQTNTYARPADG